MTDNRTTELREKLTERGIEYETNDHMGVCETSWNGFTAMQLTPGAKLMMAFTPEQAIAATIGNGTLTAGQVREAAKSNSRKYKSPVDDGVWITEYDWQAIADELNARAERTCDDFSLPEPDGWYKCPNCGCSVGYTELYGGGWSIMMDDYQIPLNACPNCGAKVRNE